MTLQKNLLFEYINNSALMDSSTTHANYYITNIHEA